MHDHRKPFPPPPPYGPQPPRPLPPDYPHFIPGDYCRPPVPAMPPVPSVVEGESLYEAVNNCIDRVNVCMDTYNSVMAECYKTLGNLQRAAEENGAYYGPADVWTEEGYDADSSAKYFIIHKRHVDRRGQPIFMELGLAYDNATNSKIEQSIFSASKVKYADKIVVAQPKTEKGWYGKAIWHGAPIQADPAANLWTVGFTKGGYMRVYSNGTGVDTMLADTVFNAMGCSGVLIQDGALTSEMYYNQIPDYNKQTSRVIMGQNIATGEVMILVTGHENDVNAKGMTSTAAAEILRQRGVTLAVELCEGESAGACDKGQLMFTPENDTVPTAYCFWYITRRRFYKNDYERELAELTQNYGQSIWQGYLNGEAIQNTAKDLAAEIERAQNAENNLDAAIKAETDRAQAAESQLDTKIEAETERALAAEKLLDNKITAETERATAEEARLDAKIDAETERATGVEADLQQQITNEVNRATEAENTLDGKITAETNRAQAREDELDEKIQDETNRATLEEGKLNTKIDTEAQRAKDAEAVLQTNIDNEQQARQNADTALGARIDSLSSDVTQQINDFKTEVNQKIDNIESNVNNLKTTVDSLGEQVAQLGNNLTSLSGTVNQIQQTVNTLQENYTTLSGAVADLNDQIDRMQSGDLDLPYLKRGGDTGTGTFNFTGATVNVAAPTADANAATKKYVDDADKVNAAAIAAETGRAEAAESSLSGLINQETTERKAADNDIRQEIANLTNGTTEMPYVKKSGDTMTGALNLPAPTENANAANKKYVDDADAVLNAAIQAETKNRETAITGVLQQIQELETGLEGDLAGYLPLTGGTMTGALNVQTPTEDANAATKAYVDSKITNLENGSTALPYVKKTGDAMTGVLNMSNNKVTDVADPTAAGDAVNKKYVDEHVPTITGPTGHMEFVDACYLAPGATKTWNKQENEIYCVQMYTDLAIMMEVTFLHNMLWKSDPATGDNFSSQNYQGFINVTSTSLEITSSTLFVPNGIAVTLYKYIEDGEQPEVDYTRLFMNLDMSGYNGETTGTTVYTGTDFQDALSYMVKTVDLYSSKLPYTGTDNSGNKWYTISTDVYAELTENSYTMAYTVKENETTVKQQLVLTKVNAAPTTKFNQIDLSNYVGGLSGSTVNTASDFNAALQYILDNNTGKHFYYGTDHTGTTWYFASDNELSALSNDSYTCGNGVQNNGTAVQETFVMNKYVEPTPSEGYPPKDQGYRQRLASSITLETSDSGSYEDAFNYVESNPATDSLRYYGTADLVKIEATDLQYGTSNHIAKGTLVANLLTGYVAFEHMGTWYYGNGKVNYGF